MWLQYLIRARARKVSNAPDRMLTRMCQRDHITAVLAHLPWLRFQVQLNVVVVTCNIGA